MNRPLIGVTADSKEMDPYLWHATPTPYIDAVVGAAGGLPMIIPNCADRLTANDYLNRLDGILITGSRSNVHPSHYGVDPTEDHEPFDHDRDATTLPLIRAAIERGLPLLAICRGIQEMNVALGGSITAAFQKNRNIEGHDYPPAGPLDERFALAHSVQVQEGSCLAEILRKPINGSPDGKVSVNSLHTQALDRLGDNLVVEAVAHDGTIEAVTVTNAPGFAVGVQWHPEYWADTDTPSNAILSAFGEAARTYMSAKSSTPMAVE